jgi:hypothetical protein
MGEYTGLHYRQIVLSNYLEGAAEDIALSMAMEMCDNWDISDDDVIVAMRQPASIANVMRDLAQLWGARTPSLVEEALS